MAKSLIASIAAASVIFLASGINDLRANYSIAQFLEDGTFTVVNHGRGQSFTVSQQGGGSGSPGGATQVQLNNVTFMYGTTFQAASAAGLGSVLYLYDALPATISDLNTGIG
jgi:hypothetical protein